MAKVSPKYSIFSISAARNAITRRLSKRIRRLRYRSKKRLTIRVPDDGLCIAVVFITSGERRTICLPLKATARYLREALGLNTCQRLYFSGFQLSNDYVLEDFGVEPKSTLLVVDHINDDKDTALVATVSADQDTATLVPLSQLPFVNSRHTASWGRFRRCVANCRDECLHPPVPQSNKLWSRPELKSFRELKKGRRVQIDLSGGGQWVDGQVVSITSITTDFDVIGSEDDQWEDESTWNCTVRLLAGEQRGNEAIVDSLSRIRGMPVPGSNIIACLVVAWVFALLQLPDAIINIRAQNECGGVDPNYLTEYFQGGVGSNRYNVDACHIFAVPVSANCTAQGGCGNMTDASPAEFARFLLGDHGGDPGLAAFNRFSCRHAGTFHLEVFPLLSALAMSLYLMMQLAETPRPSWPMYLSFASVVVASWTYDIPQILSNPHYGSYLLVLCLICAANVILWASPMPYVYEQFRVHGQHDVFVKRGNCAMWAYVAIVVPVILLSLIAAENVIQTKIWGINAYLKCSNITNTYLSPDDTEHVECPFDPMRIGSEFHNRCTMANILIAMYAHGFNYIYLHEAPLLAVLLLVVLFSSSTSENRLSPFTWVGLSIFFVYLLIRFIPMLSPARYVMPKPAESTLYGHWWLSCIVNILFFFPCIFWFAKKLYRLCLRRFYLPRAVRTAATQYASHTARLAESPKKVRQNAYTVFQPLKQHRGAKLLTDEAERFAFDLALENNILTPTLRKRQTRLFRLMGVFLESVVQASSLPQYREMLEDVVKHTKEAHKSLYEKMMAQIQQTSGEAQFHDLVVRGNAIAATLKLTRCSFQTAVNLCDLFVHARHIKSSYDAFITAIAAKTGGDARYADLKSMWRVAEKTVFRPPREKRSAPGATMIRDVVRGAIVYTHIGSMCSAMDLLVGCDDALMRSQEKLGIDAKIVPSSMAGLREQIVLRQLKNRFPGGNPGPTAGGWSDVMVTFSFEDDHDGHVCELQLIHEDMMTVRKECLAHRAYNRFRTAIELLESAESVDVQGPCIRKSNTEVQKFSVAM